MFGQHGLEGHACNSIGELVAEADAGAGLALVAEEALGADDVVILRNWVEAQPKWSDFAFVVLGNGSRVPRSRAAQATLDTLKNVVLLERPLHADALLGAVRSALKARLRQYEIRAFADTLETAVSERTAELATVREGLEIALDAAEMGSWDLDLVRNTARRTLRHDEIFGYQSLLPDWNRDIFLSHVVEPERNRISEAFDAAAITGGLDFECAIRTATGDIRKIAAKGRVRYDENRQPVRMTGVVADVTTARDAEARLAQAAKMDAIGQLTGGVAHDFNNLLTPMVGSLDLLRRRYADDERAQRLIGGALQAAERAATLTQRLLAFAKKQTLETMSVDIVVLIEGLLDLVRRSLGPTIQVDVVAARSLSPARIDPNQLELALLNLAINARDAMPHGGALTFMVDEIAYDGRGNLALDAGNYIRIGASDTGLGMDAATLARAAEPFFSTKGVGKGTGLGLSMVHGLASQSGGTLEVESAPGAGTTIMIWLPASSEKAMLLSNEVEGLMTSDRSARILLVDDEELVRTATADMLSDLGYKVIEASSGSQALAIVKAGADIDIVVTDYLMPGITGVTLIAELRMAAPSIPALLVTGYANAGSDIPDSLARLSKPFRQSELAVRIDDLLKNRQLA